MPPDTASIAATATPAARMRFARHAQRLMSPPTNGFDLFGHVLRHLRPPSLSVMANKNLEHGQRPLLSNAPMRCRLASSAQRSERRSHLGHEKRGLLPRSEVAALVELVVVDQLGIGTLRPAPRGCIDFIGEDAHGDRDLDAAGVE